MAKRKPPRGAKPNPIARSLRSQALRVRVVRPKKGKASYTRKARSASADEEPDA